MWDRQDRHVRTSIGNPHVDGARFSDHTLAEMRKHVPEAMVTVSQAEIDRLDNHPKDRHVAAVAVAASADTVLTINVKDFRSWLLEGAGITIMPPGQLLEGVTMGTAMGRVRSG